MTGLLCYLWWFLLGLLLGWLLHWLLGRGIQKNVAPEGRAPVTNGGGDYQAGFVAGEASAKRSMAEQMPKVNGLVSTQGDTVGPAGGASAGTAQLTGQGAALATASLLADVSPQGLMLAAAARTKGGQDDLRVVEGIGPKINELLITAGIDTFEKLAAAPVERVQTILDNAGPHFRLANPSSWAKQARLCADGQWDALQQLQDALTAGVDKSQSTPNADGPHA